MPDIIKEAEFTLFLGNSSSKSLKDDEKAEKSFYSNNDLYRKLLVHATKGYSEENLVLVKKIYDLNKKLINNPHLSENDYKKELKSIYDYFVKYDINVIDAYKKELKNAMEQNNLQLKSFVSVLQEVQRLIKSNVIASFKPEANPPIEPIEPKTPMQYIQKVVAVRNKEINQIDRGARVRIFFEASGGMKPATSEQLGSHVEKLKDPNELKKLGLIKLMSEDSEERIEAKINVLKWFDELDKQLMGKEWDDFWEHQEKLGVAKKEIEELKPEILKAYRFAVITQVQKFLYDKQIQTDLGLNSGGPTESGNKVRKIFQEVNELYKDPTKFINEERMKYNQFLNKKIEKINKEFSPEIYKNNEMVKIKREAMIKMLGNEKEKVNSIALESIEQSKEEIEENEKLLRDFVQVYKSRVAGNKAAKILGLTTSEKMGSVNEEMQTLRANGTTRSRADGVSKLIVPKFKEQTSSATASIPVPEKKPEIQPQQPQMPTIKGPGRKGRN